MALKVYSDITKEFYEDEATAKAAEEKLVKAKTEKTARRKEMSEKVEAARKNVADLRKEYADMLDKAQKEYMDVLEEFCREFGTYYYTINAKEAYEELDRLRDSFLRW